MKPFTFGAGVAPAVSVVDGLVYLAFGIVGGCRLVVLTPAGLEVRRVDLPGGFDQSFPRFDGPWLAYRQNAAHSYVAVALNVLTGQRWSFKPAGATFGLAVSESLGLVAYEWQRAGEWRVWFGNLLNGLTAETPLLGAPDGLDTIESARRVTLRKDTRTSVAGMLYPVRGGDLTVGERPDGVGPRGGIAVQLAGEPLRVALPGQNTPDPRCASDGTTYAIACWGGVQLLIGDRSDVQRLPLVSTPPAPPTRPREEPMKKAEVTVDEFGLKPGHNLLDGTIAAFRDRENPGGAHVRVWVEGGSCRMSIDYPGAGSGLKGETGARRPVR